MPVQLAAIHSVIQVLGQQDINNFMEPIVGPFRQFIFVLFCLITYLKRLRLANFPSPAGMSFSKLLLAGNNLFIPDQGEFGKWHPGCMGTGKRLTLFTV
jgi:hypothetical protein